jgi:hypothetical protein
MVGLVSEQFAQVNGASGASILMAWLEPSFVTSLT